jgi:hypothetical protein
VIPPPKSRRHLSQEAKAVERASKEAKLRATKLEKWTEHDYITKCMKNTYE